MVVRICVFRAPRSLNAACKNVFTHLENKTNGPKYHLQKMLLVIRFARNLLNIIYLTRKKY